MAFKVKSLNNKDLCDFGCDFVKIAPILGGKNSDEG